MVRRARKPITINDVAESPRFAQSRRSTDAGLQNETGQPAVRKTDRRSASQPENPIGKRSPDFTVSGYQKIIFLKRSRQQLTMAIECSKSQM
jgi:hypothetical protein